MPPLHRFNDDPGFIGDQHWHESQNFETVTSQDTTSSPLMHLGPMRLTQWERARQHAKDVLLLAASAGMPDTFWWTDSRVQRAIATLDTNVYAARRWAEWRAP